MTDDLSLLKSAAIAIGGEYIPAHEGYCLSLGGVTRVWNPLMDSGDALELACRLKINIEHMHSLSGKEFGINCWPYGRGDCGVSEDTNISDYAAATRRAIVRAAAALGAAMEGK